MVWTTAAWRIGVFDCFVNKVCLNIVNISCYAILFLLFHCCFVVCLCGDRWLLASFPFVIFVRSNVAGLLVWYRMVLVGCPKDLLSTGRYFFLFLIRTYSFEYRSPFFFELFLIFL